MAADTNGIDVRACASAVVGALADLQGYLSESINPDRIALADLDMEPMGWTKRAYSSKAFEIWKKQWDQFKDDPQLRGDPNPVHHLAIMHHARAFELEAGPRPADSDADWVAALKYWHRLYEMDAFWDRLTEKACWGTNRQDVVRKLREDLPQLVLAIHYDIALDSETRDRRKGRAKFHISTAQKLPFDAHVREEARRAAYGRYIRCVGDEVWHPNELREVVLQEGQKAIVEYLNFDPGCVPALEDALRIQRRIQRSRNTTWQALDRDDPERRALLLKEQKDAESWGPYFDQLVAAANELDEDLREELGAWYYGRGADLYALDLHEKAIEFYTRTVEVCSPDSDLRRRCQQDLVATLAYVGREKAATGATDARRYCERTCKRKDLTAAACYLLAQAYVQLGEFDDATSLCKRGLGVEPDFDDLDAEEWIQRLEEFKLQIPVIRLTRSGAEAMRVEKFTDALRSLDEAEKIATKANAIREFSNIYWLRAQAHLAMDHISDAKRDVNLYVAVVGDGMSESDHQALRELKEVIAAREELVNIKPLLEKARTAMEAGRFKDALPPLNEAAKRAPKNEVVYYLRCQAHAARGNFTDARRDLTALGGLAESEQDRSNVQGLRDFVEQAEEAAAINAVVERARAAMEEERFTDALRLLNEAAQKAQKNEVVYFLRCQVHAALGNLADARRDAKIVSDLAGTTEERQAAQKLSEMIVQAERTFQEFGGPEASKLRQQAIAAYNAEQMQDAIRVMRQAVDASKRAGFRDGAPKLKSELSQILTNAAISLANSAQEGIGRNISQASLSRLRRSLREVEAMLVEALALDRGNSRASENLGTVRQILGQLP